MTIRKLIAWARNLLWELRSRVLRSPRALSLPKHRTTTPFLPAWALVLAVLALGLGVGLSQWGWGGRRSVGGGDTGWITTEGGDPVNADTVRTAREIASHSTG